MVKSLDPTPVPIFRTFSEQAIFTKGRTILSNFNPKHACSNVESISRSIASD